MNAGWIQVSGGFEQIAVGSKAAVCGSNGQDIFLLVGGENPLGPWQKITGNLGENSTKQITMGADGTIWAVTRDCDNVNKIYNAVYMGNNKWQGTPGFEGYNTLSVASSNLAIGVDQSGTVFKYTGDASNWAKLPQTSNTQIISASIGVDGSIWVIDSAYNVYRYDEYVGWSQFCKGFSQISVGANNMVCGLNQNGEVYLHTGSNLRTWVQLPGPKMQSVSVGADGTVWGVDTSLHIYYYVFNNGLQITNGNLINQQLGLTDQSIYTFDVTNTSTNMVFSSITLYLLYDTTLFQSNNITITPSSTISINKLLPNQTFNCQFTIKTNQAKQGGTYGIYGVTAEYQTSAYYCKVDICAGGNSPNNCQGSWLTFNVGNPNY